MPRIEEGCYEYIKQLPVVFVIDTSLSMELSVEGDFLSAVNEGMESLINTMKCSNSFGCDFEILIGVLRFSNDAVWVTDKGLVPIDEYEWQELSAGGMAVLGPALSELGQKLSRRVFLNSVKGLYKPVIVFIIDGMPTDNYSIQLEHLRSNNKWFNVARKKCVFTNSSFDKRIYDLVDHKEDISRVDTPAELNSIIKNDLPLLINMHGNRNAPLVPYQRNASYEESMINSEEDIWGENEDW